TDVAGTNSLGNAGNGVQIESANNLIGGTVAGAGNVIAGSGVEGVLIGGSTAVAGNLVQGNRIGTDATGAVSLSNAMNGVFINFAGSNTVGGVSAAAANVIAFNGLNGVCVNNASGIAVLGNAIFSNAALGIDLTPSGV